MNLWYVREPVAYPKLECSLVQWQHIVVEAYEGTYDFDTGKLGLGMFNKGVAMY